MRRSRRLGEIVQDLRKVLVSALTFTFVAAIVLASTADARGRKGSHRIGGHNSHGKGSHYVGGR